MGDIDVVRGVLDELHEAQKAGDLDRIEALFSDEAPLKPHLRRHFGALIARGALRARQVDTSRCQTVHEGAGRATVGPVHYQLGHRHNVVVFRMAQERDGAWRILQAAQLPGAELERWSGSHLCQRSPEEVWAVLTEPAHLTQWMCNDARVELRVGGAFELRGDLVYKGGGGQRITALEPGRRLSFSWSLGSYSVETTWRLEPVLDQTRVSVEQTMSADDARRAAFDLAPGGTTIAGTYMHHLVAYLELGFAPTRLSCNPEFVERLCFDMKLPVSARAAMTALLDVDGWAGPGASKMWNWYPALAPDGRSARLERDHDDHFAVILDGDAPNADDSPYIFTLRDVPTSEDEPKAELKVVISGFGDKLGMLSVYWGWQAYLVMLAIYMVQGRVRFRRGNEWDLLPRAEVDRTARAAPFA